MESLCCHLGKLCSVYSNRQRKMQQPARGLVAVVTKRNHFTFLTGNQTWHNTRSYWKLFLWIILDWLTNGFWYTMVWTNFQPLDMVWSHFLEIGLSVMMMLQTEQAPPWRPLIWFWHQHHGLNRSWIFIDSMDFCPIGVVQRNSPQERRNRRCQPQRCC